MPFVYFLCQKIKLKSKNRRLKMRLVRYKPNRLAVNFGRDFESMFDSFFGNPWNSRAWVTEFSPRVDIAEDKDKLELRAELPGMDRDAIKVVVEDGVLTLSGEKKNHREEKNANYIVSEVCSGTFSRSFNLPDYIEAEKIKADYSNGVLTLEMPKTEKAKPKEIEVKVS
jgi:HSP20 family protein